MYVDPEGLLGVIGALTAAGMNIGFQFLTNVAGQYNSTRDFRKINYGLALYCIDVLDVIISAGFGAISPGGLTLAKKLWNGERGGEINRMILGLAFLQAYSGALKMASPPLRIDGGTSSGKGLPSTFSPL